MNWFERYGIVGLHFLIIVFIWFICITSFTLVDLIKDKNITSVFLVIFLPLGYILSILSQYLYYSWFNGKQIHKEIVKSILPEDVKRQLKLSDCFSEAECETKLTVYMRLELPKKVDNVDSLKRFSTRRFDVLAINNSIILHTITAPIVAYLLVSILCPGLRSVDYRNCFMLLLLSIISVVILLKSNSILREQILDIHREIWRKFKESTEPRAN